MLFSFNPNMSHHKHIPQHLCFFGNFVRCLIPNSHIHDYHFSSGVSCRDCFLALPKYLNTVVVVPAMQNKLKHMHRVVEIINIVTQI